MPDLACGKSAVIKVDNAASWSAARDATSGTASEPITLTIKIATAIGPYDVYRIYFAFDTSGITVAPASATLKVFGTSTTSAFDFYVVEGTSATTGSPSAAYVNGDFNKLDFSTPYSAKYDASGWSTSGFNEIELNQDARNAMASLDTFRVVLVQEKDFDNDGSSASTRSGPSMRSNSYGTVEERPLITYTEGSSGNEPQGPANASSIDSSFVITVYESGSLNEQYVRGVAQTPFSLGVRGPLSLRGRSADQVVTPKIGSKDTK